MDKRAFTLIELLVVIAIIAILAAILFPVFARTREKGNQVVCINNQRQIVQALMFYAKDNDDILPDGSGLYAGPNLKPILKKGGYIKNENIWKCPSDKNGKSTYYKDLGSSYNYGWIITKKYRNLRILCNLPPTPNFPNGLSLSDIPFTWDCDDWHMQVDKMSTYVNVRNMIVFCYGDLHAKVQYISKYRNLFYEYQNDK